MKRIIFLLLIYIASSVSVRSQELFCQVQVSYQQVQTTETQIFDKLQTAIFEFMNNRKWTNHVYKDEERIECNMLITISEWDKSQAFKGTIQISSRRPIYNTAYSSTLFNYQDKNFEFNFNSFEPLDFNESTHISNLTSILAYYAYVILGFDYDSYSEFGGTEFFEKAISIVQNAQSEEKQGWKSYQSTNNRYWIVTNLLDPTFKPLRSCMYKYHRLGLDFMSKEKERGQKSITDALMLLQGVHNSKPASISTQLFLTTKSDEIVNIYTEAFPVDKAKISTLLKQIDPSNNTSWNKING